MLERPLTQAAGLYGLGPLAGPRLVAMVCHGDSQAELPLMWQLCMAWAQNGHCVCVLDGTAEETSTNPGLQQLLAQESVPSTATPASRWSVIAAALGLRTHAQSRLASPQSPARHLSHYLAGFDILMVYDTAERLLNLSEIRGTHPVLAMTHSRTSVLTSYLALKRLLISAGLKPTIVGMRPERSGTPDPSTVAPWATSLTACAQQFLGVRINCLEVPMASDSTELSPAAQRLAQTLMEDTEVWSESARPPGRWSHASATPSHSGAPALLDTPRSL